MKNETQDDDDVIVEVGYPGARYERLIGHPPPTRKQLRERLEAREAWKKRVERERKRSEETSRDCLLDLKP